MSTLTRAARHVDQTAGTAEEQLQKVLYRSERDRSSRLEQAGEVLCLLALFPLADIERTAFGHLLERRLRRAYLGVDC